MKLLKVLLSALFVVAVFGCKKEEPPKPVDEKKPVQEAPAPAPDPE